MRQRGTERFCYVVEANELTSRIEREKEKERERGRGGLGASFMNTNPSEEGIKWKRFSA